MAPLFIDNLTIAGLRTEQLTPDQTCHQGIGGCYCKIGFPYELLCPLCRDTRMKADNHSYCICLPTPKTLHPVVSEEPTINEPDPPDSVPVVVLE